MIFHKMQNFPMNFKMFNRYRTEKKLATGLCVPFVDISPRAFFYSASHFSTEIRARVFAWPLKRHTVLYRLTHLIVYYKFTVL